MKEISLDQDVVDFLTSRATSPAEAIGAILRREFRVPQPQVPVTIDDDTYAAIAARSRVIGESASEILRREFLIPVEPPSPGPTDPAPHPGGPVEPSPTVITFHIPPGTGTASWNERATMVAAHVGDTLRLVNDDTVPHRLHTQGRPFPHPAADVVPAATADIPLLTAYNPDTDGPLYDHDSGPAARFWILVSDRA